MPKIKRYFRAGLVSCFFTLCLGMPLSFSQAQTFNPGYSSAWFNQLGITSAIENTANQGQGFTIGIVDTGITINNAELMGRVTTTSGCAAVSFKCSKGVADDNGHGTAVAAIAAGNTSTGGWMSGVAPKATIVAEKVLNASGSGYDADVANGIVQAANAGAGVINLSLTYTPTANVLNAINYATNKGAIIVFAGGNSSAALNGGANTYGLTATSLSHLVFVGAATPTNGLASYSNTPGTGNAYATNGAGKSYASLWLMGSGNNIVAPGIMYGPNAYAYWTGTSMAAPEITGSLALLENVWPVLKRNGTATSVLFQTATRLGNANTYGNGLLNLSAAFAPIGALTVTLANGQSTAVTSLSGRLLSGGALGSLSAISSKLSNYTSFDSYQRNYLLNLSSLITTKPASTGQIISGAQAPTVTSGKTNFANGDTVAYAYSESNNSQAITRPESTGAKHNWYSAFTSSNGTSLAFGQGFPGSHSFADTLWGFDSKTADSARTLGISSSIMKLADGGTFSSFGHAVGDNTRVAFAFSDSGYTKDPYGGNDWQKPNANAFSSGISTRIDDSWSVGTTFSYLTEQNGLLGSVYDNQSLVSLGNNHQTMSMGFSSSLDLSDKTGLLFEGVLARSNGARIDNSLITSVSDLLARSYGASLVTRDAFNENDHLSLSLRKPLRVISGSASIAGTDVDADGYATTTTTRTSLVPTGSETNLAVEYATPLSQMLSFTGTASFSQDAENVRGQTGAGINAAFRLRF